MRACNLMTQTGLSAQTCWPCTSSHQGAAGKRSLLSVLQCDGEPSSHCWLMPLLSTYGLCKQSECLLQKLLFPHNSLAIILDPVPVSGGNCARHRAAQPHACPCCMSLTWQLVSYVRLHRPALFPLLLEPMFLCSIELAGTRTWWVMQDM